MASSAVAAGDPPRDRRDELLDAVAPVLRAEGPDAPMTALAAANAVGLVSQPLSRFMPKMPVATAPRPAAIVTTLITTSICSSWLRALSSRSATSLNRAIATRSIHVREQ